MCLYIFEYTYNRQFEYQEYKVSDLIGNHKAAAAHMHISYATITSTSDKAKITSN